LLTPKHTYSMRLTKQNRWLAEYHLDRLDPHRQYESEQDYKDYLKWALESTYRAIDFHTGKKLKRKQLLAEISGLLNITPMENAERDKFCRRIRQEAHRFDGVVQEIE
jgi:hypothetical protein